MPTPFWCASRAFSAKRSFPKRLLSTASFGRHRMSAYPTSHPRIRFMNAARRTLRRIRFLTYGHDTHSRRGNRAVRSTHRKGSGRSRAPVWSYLPLGVELDPFACRLERAGPGAARPFGAPSRDPCARLIKEIGSGAVRSSFRTGPARSRAIASTSFSACKLIPCVRRLELAQPGTVRSRGALCRRAT